MVRHRLAGQQRKCIAEVFPAPAESAHPRANLRDILDGILRLVKAGSLWRDWPENFGPWDTVYTGFERWTSDGMLGEVLGRLTATMSGTEDFDHDSWCSDGTAVQP